MMAAHIGASTEEPCPRHEFCERHKGHEAPAVSRPPGFGEKQPLVARAQGYKLLLSETSATGYLGVRPTPSGRFVASKWKDGKSLSLGRYDSVVDAAVAVAKDHEAERKAHGLESTRELLQELAEEESAAAAARELTAAGQAGGSSDDPLPQANAMVQSNEWTAEDEKERGGA